MRAAPTEKIEAGRIRKGAFGSDSTYGCYGMFDVVGPMGARLRIMSTAGEDTGWEHVSVSKDRNPPNWREMCWVKDQFWSEDECVVQFHPPKADHVNNVETCLHLWRSRIDAFPRPSSSLVGDKRLGVLR